MDRGDFMHITEAICNKLMGFIARTFPDKSQVELDEVHYGMFVLINNLLELPVIFIIAVLFGVFKEVLIAFLAFSFLRSFASGIHAQKPLGCFLSTTAIYFGATFLGKTFTLHFIDLSAVFIASCILIILHAPADTENRPLVSKKLRKKLKIGSLGVASLLYIIELLMLGSHYSSVIAYSVLIECITIMPATYVIFKRRYNNYESYGS